MKQLLYTFPLFLFYASAQAQITVDVSAYGAKGDGITDNAIAFQKAADKAATMASALVTIPAGNYYVSKTINFRLSAGKKLKIAGAGIRDPKDKRASVIFTKALCAVFYFDCTAAAMGGSVECDGVCLKGNNTAYTAHHPYYNTGSYTYGLVTNNIEVVRLVNNYVGSFYGGGIRVVNAKQMSNALTNRSRNVLISNNLITDCWGLHISKDKSGFIDNYGDGIYLDNVINATIASNKIENNTSTTRSLGRAGIVLEYNTQDCTIQNNVIFGYDRNIHVEADFGGHIIRDNKLSGSDLGILIHSFALKRADGKPSAVTIQNNQISNIGFTKGLQTAWSSNDRALISIHSVEGERKGTQVTGNTLTYDSHYELKSNTLLQNHEWYVSFRNNIYNAILLNGKSMPAVVHDYQLQDLVDEKYNNVQVNFKASGAWGDNLIRGQFKGNKMGGKAVTNLKLK